MAEKLTFDIQVGGNQDQALGSLKAQLKEATLEVQKLSDKFGATSDQAIQAAKRAAELKDQIGDAATLVDAFNPDTKFKALSQTLGTVAGGFAAVQGALGLIGSEGEDVQKTLAKVQSALALSQGLEQLGDLSTAFSNVKSVALDTFKGIKTAIGSTGIGILLVSLGLLVANFDKVKEAVSNLIPGLKQIGTFFGNIITKVTDFVGITSQAERALAALEKTTKRGNEGIEARIKVLTAQGGKEKEIYALSKQQGENELNFLRAKLKTKEGLNAEELKKFRDLKTEQAVLDAQENKRIIDGAKETANKSKEISDKLAEEEAARLQKQLDDEKKLTQDLLDEYDKRRKFLATSKIITQKEISEADEEERLKQEEAENKKFDSQIASLGKTKNYTLELIKNNQETNAKLKADNDAAREAELTARLSFAASVAMAIGELNGLFEQGTAASKVAGLAQIAINTGVGFAQGLSIAQQSAKATGPAAAFAFPIFYATQIAAVLAAAGKAKSILSQVKGGGAGGSVTAPSIQQQAPIAPAQPQAQTTSLNSETINALGNQATRAYVIESDVTSSQQRIAAIKQRARFG